jgi:hypothetical protein
VNEFSSLERGMSSDSSGPTFRTYTVLTAGLYASIRTMMTRIDAIPQHHSGSVPFLWANSIHFINERLVSLAVFLHWGDRCPFVREATYQDSLTCSDRGWVVSRSHGDLHASPASVGYLDLYGTGGLSER